MTDRHSADTINSDALDALYERAEKAEADVQRWLAFIERGMNTHMQFNVLRDDGTAEQLPCADWCYACRVEKAEAAVARARALADSRQTAAANGGRTDADTIWPSEILTALDEPPAPKICELPHQTIEEENACEQQRLVLDEPKDQ